MTDIPVQHNNYYIRVQVAMETVCVKKSTNTNCLSNTLCDFNLTNVDDPLLKSCDDINDKLIKFGKLIWQWQ